MLSATTVFVLFVSLVVFLSQSGQCSSAAPPAAPSTQRVIDLRGAENQTSIVLGSQMSYSDRSESLSSHVTLRRGQQEEGAIGDTCNGGGSDCGAGQYCVVTVASKNPSSTSGTCQSSFKWDWAEPVVPGALSIKSPQGGTLCTVNNNPVIAAPIKCDVGSSIWHLGPDGQIQSSTADGLPSGFCIKVVCPHSV